MIEFNLFNDIFHTDVTNGSGYQKGEWSAPAKTIGVSKHGEIANGGNGVTVPMQHGRSDNALPAWIEQKR